MKTLMQKISAQLIGSGLAVLFMMPAFADDIEIYVGNALVSGEVKPNLMFIIDTSGSMRAKVNTPLPYDINVDYSQSPYSGGCFDPDKIYFSTGTTPVDCATDDWFNRSALKCDAATQPMFNTTPPTVVTDPPIEQSDSGQVPKGPDDIAYTETVDISSSYDETNDTTTTVSETTTVTISGGNKRTVVSQTTSRSTGPALGHGWYQDRIAQWKVNADPNREAWEMINNGQKNWFIECKVDSAVHGVDASSPAKYIANLTPGPYTTTTTNAADWNATGRGYVLYTGNYLNWAKVAPVLDDANSPNRLDVVKDVTYSVVDSTNNINIGLMRFDSRDAAQGGPVRYPVLDVTQSRNDFKARLRTMKHGGYTPLSETLYESYLYWAGKDVKYGNSSNPSNSTGVTLTGSGNKTYDSPIDYTCQKNFNIFLSDGDPSRDGDANSEIKTLIGKNCVDNCMDELAQYMHENDIYDGLADKQSVTTYTVGFASDHPLLRATAEKSGGKYYQANNAAELTEIFNKIIAEILSVNTTFSSPAVSINAFNRSTHRNELYFTLFKPGIGPHWNGNLKRFKLVFDADGLPVIKDYANRDAINAKTGFFDAEAHSWWTDVAGEADGGEVVKGGAAAHIAARTVYTYTASTDPVMVDLTLSNHRFHEDNTNITDAMMAVKPSDPIGFRNKVIQWARGLDAYDDNGDGSTSDARKIMGDPLHSEPALIQYDASYITDPSSGLSVIDPNSDPDITAYVATNDGILHAIDTRTGEEIFSFIPQETLAMQRTVAENLAGNGKAYGIDGSINSLVIDVNQNGIIEASTDKVYIFFGQRRGGDHYYAMDVTNREKPILMWKIKGGVGDFKYLSQTWSNIQVKKIKLQNKDKYVLVFGGGYDLDQDAVTSRTADNIGNAVYIVDALGEGGFGGGSRLWWASAAATADLVLADMKYSIPARLKAVDVRGDGYLDRIYVGDMGGQIWRFDIQKGETTGATLSSLVSGGRIADLGADGSKANNRRFYYPPDVAFIAEPDKAPYLALAIASGYRAHPLERGNHDRIYMLRDNYLFDPPPATVFSAPITEAGLYDATANTIGQGATDAIKAAEITNLNAAQGWYVTLDELDGSFIGEKGLSEVLIIEGLVVASTYIPQDSATAKICEPVDGKGRVYFMNLGDATPVYNFDKSVDSTENLTREDRYQQQVGGGIPPGATPIFTEDGSAVLVGTETVTNPIDNTPKPLFWYEQ
ncbi:MAG: PilC/PilY family type IV pilus protein [Gammaproteobacteria bacterium]|nr:PilC/PilY family type IV pilus protein [Gammaproteobacteria bacterium]